MDYTKCFRGAFILTITWFTFTAIRVLTFSKQYSNSKSDVAIVLGAGSNQGTLSPVFIERMNHAIKLYYDQKVNYLILTGGVGEGQTISDSEAAKQFALKKGFPEENIFIEEESKTTYENLVEANKLVESKGFKQSLIVSDPLHMFRSLKISEGLKMNAKSSPTQTSMYRSFITKAKSLVYETFYYQIDIILGHL